MTISIPPKYDIKEIAQKVAAMTEQELLGLRHFSGQYTIDSWRLDVTEDGAVRLTNPCTYIYDRQPKLDMPYTHDMTIYPSQSSNIPKPLFESIYPHTEE